MMHIKRPTLSPDFFEPSNIWVIETKRAIEHYAKNLHSQAFVFNAYRNARIKDELKKVFLKCAYCDSHYASVGDGDIEHFRPKLKVSGKDPETPGYYWLANSWENLFLSCQHCNQSRWHDVVGFKNKLKQGKRDQFPLSDESKRVIGPEGSIEEENEYVLLVNPCLDSPEEHFQYDSSEAVIIPTTQKASTSIEVFALQRKLLVDRRKERLIELFRQIGRVKRSLEKFNHTLSIEDKEEFNYEFKILVSFTHAEKDFAGMCRFFVKAFLRENTLI